MTDAGDAKAVRQFEKAHKLRSETAHAHLVDVLGSVAGRAVMWNILETCGVYRLSYHNNPHEMAFREGNRQIGLRLLADIQVAKPGVYLLMQQEANTRAYQGGL